jgi:hypothetical protein
MAAATRVQLVVPCQQEASQQKLLSGGLQHHDAKVACLCMHTDKSTGLRGYKAYRNCQEAHATAARALLQHVVQ